MPRWSIQQKNRVKKSSRQSDSDIAKPFHQEDKNEIKNRLVQFTLALMLITSPSFVLAESNSKHSHDALDSAPHHHKSLLENATVRVLETKIAPGERTPVHSHPWPAALYVLSWSDFVRYDPDGKVMLDSRTIINKKSMVGSATWSDPVPPHSIHNVGKTMLHVIAVEIKRP